MSLAYQWRKKYFLATDPWTSIGWSLSHLFLFHTTNQTDLRDHVFCRSILGSADPRHLNIDNPHNIQSVFSTVSQGLEDDILKSSLARWADTADTYCPGRPSQIVLKSMTKPCDRVEKTLCTDTFYDYTLYLLTNNGLLKCYMITCLIIRGSHSFHLISDK